MDYCAIDISSQDTRATIGELQLLSRWSVDAQMLGLDGDESLAHTIPCIRYIFTYIYWLVVEPTQLKNMIVKRGIFPNFRGENNKHIWVATTKFR